MIDRVKIIKAVMMTNNIELAKKIKRLLADLDEITHKLEHYDSLSDEEKESYYDEFMELYNSKKSIENDIAWLVNAKNS
jgi:phosphotransacetylase